MHTSSILKATDFRYRWSDSGEPADFGAFCPDYHENDRLAVVCTCLEDGVLHTGYGLLAVATAFYDVLRGRGGEFFDYPRHFAFVDVDEKGVSTRGERVNLDHAALAAPWSNLDVWPETQWVPVPSTADGMLREVYRYQVNRLLWPAGLVVDGECERPLPGYARRLLGSRLKSVYTYGGDSDNIELTISERAAEIVTKSLGHLPGWQEDADLPRTVGYQRVVTDPFLTSMEGCFSNGN